MRVKGNILPNVLDVEPYVPMPGCVEVRLRENMKSVEVADEMSGKTLTMYEYDEYTFILKDHPNLKDEIQANMADWMTTGRTLEINEGASIFQDMKAALEIVGVSE